MASCWTPQQESLGWNKVLQTLLVNSTTSCLDHLLCQRNEAGRAVHWQDSGENSAAGSPNSDWPLKDDLWLGSLHGIEPSLNSNTAKSRRLVYWKGEVEGSEVRHSSKTVSASCRCQGVPVSILVLLYKQWTAQGLPSSLAWQQAAQQDVFLSRDTSPGYSLRLRDSLAHSW